MQPNSSQPQFVARCTTCNIKFDGMDAMRAHYGTPLHLHNVRLRVEGKLPVTQSEFLMSGAPGFVEDALEPAMLFHCKLCLKTYRSAAQLKSHLKSTAHLMRKERRIIEKDSEAASMLSSTSLGSAAIGLHRRHKAHHRDAMALKAEKARIAAPAVPMNEREEDVSASRCMLCGHASDNMEDNLKHLAKVHSFYIPLEERCTNIEGLMEYLARKVNGLMCLVCGEKTKAFPSLEALRDHMAATQHNRVVLGPEYNDFYEGRLMDMEANEDTGRSACTQLVVADGRKTIFRRDGLGSYGKRSQETIKQKEERRLIADRIVEERSLVKKAASEAVAPEIKQARSDLIKFQREAQKKAVRQGLLNTKLHPKGYDGEGQMA